jgi:two-component system phosphate regulon sensor histidine kinase PhoR
MAMSETREGGERSGASRLRRRLFQARWTLLASLVAIVAVAQAPSHRTQVAAMAILGVLLVTLFAPRRSSAERRAATTAQARFAPLEGVLAADLATAVPDPLIVFDQRGTIVHVNPAAAVAFGAVAAGVSLHLKFRTPEMHALIEGVVADPASVHPVDYMERVPVERVFRVFASAIGRASGLYALVFRDQSETRRIDRMRADFIANASHELRTPLASIGGFVETLRGPARNDAAARDHFLQIMQEQTQRMARLIDDLLSLSRLEMKPYSRTGPAVDLVRIVEAVVASLAPLATESGVVIERDIAAVPVEVAGDRDELFQVFENLLENAIKYGQSGGRVAVAVTPAGAGGATDIQVSFRDFGPGIAEEHIPRITERFYRVDVETSRARKGTGLGLAIVKHILTRHDGWLEVKSEVGKGSTFIAHFPAPAVRLAPRPAE